MPAISGFVFARLAEALAIVFTKVTFTVGDGDFLADLDGANGHNFDAGLTRGPQHGIRIAVVVGKASGSHEETGAFAPRAHDDAEILLARGNLLLLLGRHGDLDAREIFDRLIALNVAASHDASLVCHNGVAIRGTDLKGTVGHVDVDIASEVISEVGLFFLGFEAVAEPAQAVDLEQFLDRSINVLVEDNFVLEDFGDDRFRDAARGVVGRSILGNSCPVIYLATAVRVIL